MILKMILKIHLFKTEVHKIQDQKTKNRDTTSSTFDGIQAENITSKYKYL